jgi:hypothetical protein
VARGDEVEEPGDRGVAAPGQAGEHGGGEDAAHGREIARGRGDGKWNLRASVEP